MKPVIHLSLGACRAFKFSKFKLSHFGKKHLIFTVLLLTQGLLQTFAQNPIVEENLLPGANLYEWDNVWNAGDPSIQGFSTEMSVNKGSAIQFKVDVNTGTNKRFFLKIYRLGYYQGNGARLVADLGVIEGVTQPAPLIDESVGLVDCGNWSVSASWNVPATAVSGIYVAKLVRESDYGASHIVFVVRDDARSSDLLFKTSDATWQAYNIYGGPSMYYGGTTSMPNGRASKISYNRPMTTRSTSSDNFVFAAEFPMLQWLERNGYDVTYSTDVDFDRDATPITPSRHRAILSVGHDEYWSKHQRDRVESARNSGVHLAFFSGNEVYWKTRWESSIDGTNQDHRTLVCYKEGEGMNMGENVCGSQDCDPLTGVWTGLWRYGQQEDAGKPENMLTGQLSWAERRLPLVVPGMYRNLRFWRNTRVADLAAGGSLTLGTNIIGYEFNYEQEQFRKYYPKGRIEMSSTSMTGDGVCCAFQDQGEYHYNTIPGRVYTHKLTLYRHQSGALVFAAGTVSWSWGLESKHDTESSQELPEIQQATINLLADMNVQPTTLQPGLVAATATADLTAPLVTITSPTQGTNVGQGKAITITGTATETGGGVIAGVEVSLDGGLTWDNATLTQFGMSSSEWTYTFIPSELGNFSVMVRGFDDSGNLGEASSTPSPNHLTLTGTCPCSIFSPLLPVNSSLVTAGAPVTVGMKFRADTGGFIVGARFYKTSGNTGLHVARLFAADGTLLATADFINETATGWQQVTFPAAVSIDANVTYVIAYYSAAGHYNYSDMRFVDPVQRGPLTGLQNGQDGYNGLLRSGDGFPSENPNEARNYLVDAIFNTVSSCPSQSTLVTAGQLCVGENVQLRFNSNSGQAPYQLVINEAGMENITTGTLFTAPHIQAPGAESINASIWPAGTGGNASSVTTARELGVKFRAAMQGQVSAIRFFKTAASGTGVFRVYLYDPQLTGGPIGSGNITISQSGTDSWQTVQLDIPVLIEANKTYIASYFAPNGRYSETIGGLSNTTTLGPLTAPASLPGDANGIYKTGSGSGAPNETDNLASNYWVDVVFTATVSVRLSQVTDQWGVTCISTHPYLQRLTLVPFNCAFLPVTLTQFSLAVKQSDVMLQWQTSSESNNRGFDVQRSTDGQHWSDIQFIKGAGNSQTVQRYQFTDKEVPAGKYFYRLSQVDFDNKKTLSKTLTANLGQTKGFSLSQNYPNPAKGTTIIQFTLPESAIAELSLYDIAGRKIRELVNGKREAGHHSVSVTLTGLQKGIYFYRFKAGNFTETKRMIIE